VEPLTKRQAQVLEVVRERIAADGRPPTLREIARRIRIASTHGVRRHLAALERKGYVERQGRTARGIALSADLREAAGLPIVGRVAAGTPITAEENLDGFLGIDTLFGGGALFCLRVEGDSMVDAGIWDGDYVVVRQKADFHNGETGVAVIDEEATVKRLRRAGRCIELVPANEQYQTVRIDPSKQEFRYAGEVVGVHRALGGGSPNQT
jgi:repressor LexA